MNGIYFFVPFLLVTGLGIYQDTFGATVTVGYDFFDVRNPDGSHTWTSHPPYIHDGNNWVPFIQNGNEIVTAHGNVRINADGSFTWTDKGITDKIVAKYADVSDLNTWTYPTTLNNDIPDISWDGEKFTSSKIKTGIGQLDYKYILSNGKWKTQLEATNLSGLSTKAFGFDQILDIESDTIKFGGQTRNLDNFDGVTFDKEFLDANRGKVLEFLDGMQFDFDIAYDDLYSITVHDTGLNKSQLVFDYRTSTPLLPNNTLILDPVFGWTAATNVYTAETAASATTSCATGNTKTSGDSQILRKYDSTDPTGYCRFEAAQWSTAAIPDGVTVLDVKFRFDIAALPSDINCDVTPVTGDITSITAAQLMTDIQDGTPYVTNDTYCTAIANDITVDLGTSANSDLQGGLASDDLFAIGIVFTDRTRDGSVHSLQSANKELEVTYTTVVQPDAITDLATASVGSITASLSFTPPDLNGETLQNYMLNITTPQQDTPPSTFWMNGSSSPFAVTGLTAATDYSASASAYTTSGGKNWTSANVLNFTTANVNTPAAVTTLSGTSNIALSLITLTWTAPAEGGAPITGYMVNYTTPVGSPETKIENDTGTTDTSYQVLNLVIGTQYSFRVCAWNIYGCGAGGNIWNGTVETDYQIGNFSSPDVTNTNDFSIFFERTDINSTAIDLDVTYPNSYNLTCSMYYSFARENNTYSNLSSTASGDDLVSTFQFINVTNDIITVTCADTITGDSSRYVITLTQFPFLDQIDNLRNGTYGTYFQIGAIDGITFMVVLIGMIGLNRTTPIAGVMFVIIATLGLAFFGIVTYPVIMYPALALLAVWGFMSTRKDD